MQYIFILGNHPALSMAEIASQNLGELKLLNPEVALLDTQSPLDASALIKKLGGTIKIAELLCTQNYPDAKKIFPFLNSQEGKLMLGISFYGKKYLNIKKLGLELKNLQKDMSQNCRLVTSKEKTLSSVVVTQNKLIEKGAEIIIIQKSDKFVIGRTLAVQDFKGLGLRDFGRPARDDESGMLPPKLAQIMINLSQAKPKDTLLDPFCGSGTVIMEASLMGINKLIGTDNSSKAIEDTKKNISWIQKKLPTINCKLQIFQSDATQISKRIDTDSIDKIVTEPYLGPQRGKFDIKNIIKELDKLYSQSIKEFQKILKTSGTVIMIWPQFKIGTTTNTINPNINGFKLVNPLPDSLQYLLDKNNPRPTLIYGRENQRVWREMVILKKE